MAKSGARLNTQPILQRRSVLLREAINRWILRGKVIVVHCLEGLLGKAW